MTELVRNSYSIVGAVAEQDILRNSMKNITALQMTDPPEPLKIVLISRSDSPANRYEKSFRNALITAFSQN